MNPMLLRIIVTAGLGLLNYFSQKIGPEASTAMTTLATYLAVHYFHVQPSPASTEDTGSP